MEREIFRVWNGHEMEYNVMVGKFGIFYVNPDNDGIDPNDNASLSPFNTKYPDDITLMRYTGIKDKSNNKIFQKDVVTDGKYKWIIEWHDQQAMWWMSPVIDSKVVGDEYLIMTLNNEKLGNGYYSRKDLKVIGNTYDNPELLK